MKQKKINMHAANDNISNSDNEKSNGVCSTDIALSWKEYCKTILE